MKISWNEETGVATVTINVFGAEFTGTAICHEDDTDMKSELTGLHIAEARVIIKAYQHYKNNILKPQIQILNKLMNEMKQGSYFDPRSQYVRLLRRKIAILTKQLRKSEQLIELTKKDLREYINTKETFYKKVRAKRLVKND